MPTHCRVLRFPRARKGKPKKPGAWQVGNCPQSVRGFGKDGSRWLLHGSRGVLTKKERLQAASAAAGCSPPNRRRQLR